MANGELCKYCGHQETAHELKHEYDNRNKKIEGYSRTLTRCKEFVSEESAQKSDLEADQFYFEAMERRAAGRAAFGMYSAYVRQKNLDNELAEIEKAGGSDVENRKRLHIESRTRIGGFYIG